MNGKGRALSEVVESEFVSSDWLVKTLRITYDTASRNLSKIHL